MTPTDDLTQRATEMIDSRLQQAMRGFKPLQKWSLDAANLLRELIGGRERLASEVWGRCWDCIPELLGQPKTYNWAKQNYNAGHDQAVHAMRRAMGALTPKEPTDG